MFDFDLTDLLKLKIKKIAKKDSELAKIINKKIKEIIKQNEKTIDRYKNLRYDLKEYKRVHITKSFVLPFKVDKGEKFILFTDFDHHDKIY